MVQILLRYVFESLPLIPFPPLFLPPTLKSEQGGPPMIPKNCGIPVGKADFSISGANSFSISLVVDTEAPAAFLNSDCLHRVIPYSYMPAKT